ncbi:MAG: G5 domain-containing protein [Clostridia bacterium]|nr:G5 domain-containing protein [Clostridia bacterium]
MKNEEKASISIMKIICVSVILILISGIGVMAVSTNLKDVKIALQNGYELTVLTSKSKVSDVLEENNIILNENQKTIPDCDQEISNGTVIKIVDKSYNEVQIAKVSEEGIETTLNELLNNYTPIIEKIVTEQVAIPYETVTKNTAGTSTNTTNKILQQGQEGIKEVTYKVKYQNNVEIEKLQLSEKIVKEPVNKIVQVNKVVTSRSATTRTSNTNTATTSNAGAQRYKVTAYCPCAKCCGKSNGITAAGTRATAGRTVAASSKFSFGTKLNINGHVYTVEDRGGAISGNKIDIFVNSHAEALAWGVRYLPVSVVNQ